ncbi:MAG: hypothetical protein LE168_05380, partial [Endomicrobium sp.]|nr:hypothetical protein [Endomicrobium sp.]
LDLKIKPFDTRQIANKHLANIFLETRGSIKEVLEDIKNRQNLLGEFVVLIYPKNGESKEQ